MYKKNKVKSFSKPLPIVKTSDTTDNLAQFEIELCWCVQQLENSLKSGKLNQKLAEDTSKNVKILKSSTAPLIKKRQVMKMACGDYRSKMKAEEKKMALAAKQIKFTENIEASKKYSFVKKSAFTRSGNDFRFNFQTNHLLDSEFQTEGTNNKSDDCHSQDLVNKMNLCSGQQFRFNFRIHESNDELNLNGLSLAN